MTDYIGKQIKSMRYCADCEFNDGNVYTSLPPMYRCTITDEYHFGNYECDCDVDTHVEKSDAQPETAKRTVGKSSGGMTLWYQCGVCNEPVDAHDNFCRGCGRRLTDE